MRREVVQDDMGLPAPILFLDRFQEVQELGRPVLRTARSDAAVTSPVPTFSAANSIVVPCRT
jgi:hypothetical protein